MVVDKVQEADLMAQTPPGALFEHYKGKRYKVLTVGRHSETLELCVVYEALYDSPEFGKIWVRPLEMFLGSLVVDGEERPRFKRVH